MKMANESNFAGQDFADHMFPDLTPLVEALFPSTEARTGMHEHWMGTPEVDEILEDRTLNAILDEILEEVVDEMLEESERNEYLYDYETN